MNLICSEYFGLSNRMLAFCCAVPTERCRPTSWKINPFPHFISIFIRATNWRCAQRRRVIHGLEDRKGWAEEGAIWSWRSNTLSRYFVVTLLFQGVICVSFSPKYLLPLDAPLNILWIAYYYRTSKIKFLLSVTYILLCCVLERIGELSATTIWLRLSHFRSLEHCQHKSLTSTSWTDHRPFPFTIRYVLKSYIVWPFMNIYVFAYLGKMFAFTKWTNYGGGLDEMD